MAMLLRAPHQIMQSNPDRAACDQMGLFNMVRTACSVDRHRADTVLYQTPSTACMINQDWHSKVTKHNLKKWQGLRRCAH